MTWRLKADFRLLNTFIFRGSCSSTCSFLLSNMVISHFLVIWVVIEPELRTVSPAFLEIRHEACDCFNVKTKQSFASIVHNFNYDMQSFLINGLELKHVRHHQSIQRKLISKHFSHR